MKMRNGPTLTCAVLVTLLTACGGGSSASPDCRFDEAWENGQCSVEITIPPLTIPDGIWRGADAGNRAVVVLVNRFNSFQYVDGFGNQAIGEMVITNGDTVTSNFDLVTHLGETFVDGTTLADCSFSGTLVQRETMTVTKRCITTAGLAFDEVLVLSFDALYLRTASSEIIAGNYQTPLGSTLNISSEGVLFVQDAASSCVTNGEIRTTVSFTNMYFIDYEIDNCTGPATIWNGASFSGLAFLDNTFSPESLEYAVVGDVDGVPVSVVMSNNRI